MSRSGTSLIAQILHTLGATLPDDVIGPDRGNPAGHWEPRALVEINDQILSHVGLAWDDPRPLPDGWVCSLEAHGFALRIKAQIERDYAGSRLLLIKDPRLCRLLPLYCDALDMLDIEPSILLGSPSGRGGAISGPAGWDRAGAVATTLVAVGNRG